MVRGHFTTMQARGGAVQGLDLHMARLRAAQRMVFDATLDEDALRGEMRAALSAAQGGDCSLRIAFRGPSAARLEVEPPRETSAVPLRVRSHQGLRARPGIKHLDLGLQLEAREAARAAGFDDALLVDADRRIAEGSFWNLALWDGQAVVWPEAPVLEGVTQQRLQAALRRAGIPQLRAVVTLGGLAGMRAAFALNSRGLQEVSAIDDVWLPGDATAPARLRDLLAEDPWHRP